jgi:Cdc6-like AAA superfamily ATPase
MEEILLQLGLAVHGKEATSDLVKRFMVLKKKLLVCLDESDHMKDTDILYDLSRSSCGLVLISNQAFALSEIDNRIKSSLFLNEVQFRPYSKEEILEILRERASYGLRQGSISENLLSIVAGMSNGDARIGLQTLKVAAKCARKYRLSYLLGKLNEHQRTLRDSEKVWHDTFRGFV